MFACAYGAAFGAIQQMPRIVPGLPEVRALTGPQQQQTASVVQGFQEIGGLVGRFALAFLAVRIVSRRKLLHVFQVPGMIVLPLVFFYAGTTSLELAKWGMALAGFFTVAQLSFWGNYLPRVYPTHLRGTGEGFAANIGGRMLGTGFAFVTTQLTNVMPGATPPTRLAYAAALVGFGVYLSRVHRQLVPAGAEGRGVAGITVHRSCIGQVAEVQRCREEPGRRRRT